MSDSKERTISSLYFHTGNSGLTTKIKDQGSGPVLELRSSTHGNLRHTFQADLGKWGLRVLAEQILSAVEDENITQAGRWGVAETRPKEEKAGRRLWDRLEALGMDRRSPRVSTSGKALRPIDWKALSPENPIRGELVVDEDCANPGEPVDNSALDAVLNDLERGGSVGDEETPEDASFDKGTATEAISALQDQVDDANRLNLQLILTLAAVKNTDLPVDEILDHMDEAGDPHAAYNELIEYERDMLEIDDNMLESTEDDELPF